MVVRGALPALPVGYRVIQRHKKARWVIMVALRVIQGSTARRSEIQAPEKHVEADPRSGVYPTEPGDPGRERKGEGRERKRKRREGKSGRTSSIDRYPVRIGLICAGFRFVHAARRGFAAKPRCLCV